MSPFKLLVCGASSCAALSTPLACRAEPDSDQGRQAEHSKSPSEVSPVVVTARRARQAAALTATKTDAPISITPINVQVVTAATLQDQAVTRLDQALVNVSGVTVSGGGGADDGQSFSSIIIRGFGNDAHFRNGVRLDSFGSDSGTSAVQIANIESVDVLKGPAAILYGQVEPGGIVNIVTKQPEAMPAYSAEAQFGGYGLYRVTADATGPLVGNGALLYRLVGSWENSGSPTQFLFNRTNFVAPSLTSTPTARDRLTIEGEYRSVDEGQEYGYELALNGVPRLGNIHTNYGETSPLKEDTWLVNARWTHGLSAAWSLSVNQLYQAIAVNGAGVFPYYLQTDPTQPSGLSVGRFINNVFDHDSTTSTNVDLVGHFNTGPIAHTLLIGGDFVRFTYKGGINQIGQLDPNEASYVDAFNPDHPGTAFGAALGPFTRGDQRVSTGGAYVQDQLSLPHGFHVLGGGRFQWVRETSDFGFLAPPTAQPSLEGQRVTPRIGVLWEAGPGVSLYGNYAENFGASNGYSLIYNAADPANSSVVPPTSAHQWEVGLKLATPDNRLTATIDWYNLTKTNIPSPDLAHPGFDKVIGEARSQGLEFDARGTILPGWQIIANYAYTLARTTVSTDPSNPPGTPFGEVPRQLAHVWSTYEWRGGALTGLTIGGGVTVHGAERPTIWDGDQTHPDIPGWRTVDLVVSYGWRQAGHKFTAQINATNILDRRYYSDVQWAGFPGATDARGNTWAGITAIHGDPRNVIGSIRVDF